MNNSPEGLPKVWRRGHREIWLGLVAILTVLIFTPAQAADNWTVTIRVHEATSLTDDDASGEDDMYWNVSLTPTIGIGGVSRCSAEEDHDDDNNHITPTDWACMLPVTGGANTTVQIVLTLMEHDSTSGDDEFDINPAPGQLGILMNFTPADSRLSIVGVAGRDTPQCAPGRIKMRGIDGDDQAEIVFSVSASLVGAPDGDSDNDGLADTWEVCGIDGDGDGTADVNLAGLGANRFRKDIFAEIDWMLQPGAGGHTHAPWLPALINAWNEFNVAQVTNPTVNGQPTAGGIALHVDTGLLYSSYPVDFNGDGVNEITVPASGDFDVDGNGTIDIGNLGPLSGGPVGGNALAEDPLLIASVPAPVPPATISGHSFFDQGSEYDAIKTANFQAARNWAFHYIVFGHQYASTWVGFPTNGSSGLSDDCGGRPTCNNMMVTLGGWSRQTRDATGPAGVPDGIPDVPGPPGSPPVVVMNGPGGLPVDGTIFDHAGTFLHELGHNLGLRHGGGDDLNFKPNLLSIMNYSWALSGVGFDTALPNNTFDAVGVDFDRNGFPDLRRFIYSGIPNLNPPLAALNEGVVPPPFLNETVGIDTNPGMTSYSCPAAPPPPPPGVPVNPVAPLLRGNQAIDWNCDGVFQASVAADVNNITRNSGFLEILNGDDEYNRLRNGGLRFNQLLPDISLEQQRQLKSSQVRIVEPTGRQEFFDQWCERPRLIDFEDFQPGTVVSGQYGPTANFLSDGQRTPEIVDGPGRNNVPTRSEHNSLLNRPRRDGAPMVIEFSPPLRAVSFYFGQAGLTDSQRERVRMVIAATDQNDLPMGEIRKRLPPPNIGITEFASAITVWPDEFIKRLEIRYETDFPNNNVQLREPVQIDNLMVCETVRESGAAPPPPKAPVFGSIPVNLRIESEMVFLTPAADGGPNHYASFMQPFTGLTVDVDGAVSATNLALTRPEGTNIVVTAPADYGGRSFRYWKHSSGVSFGITNNSIPLTLLANGVLTAVYEGRRVEERPRPPFVERFDRRRLLLEYLLGIDPDDDP